MRIDHAAIRPFASRLTHEAALAPRAAVLALFTLMPQPTDVLAVATWESPGHRGAEAWTLLGLEQGGLAIVRATVGAGGGEGDGVVVSARWHPTGHLRCVGVTALEAFPEQLEVGDYVGRLSWLVRIEGEGELILPTPEGGDATAIEQMCRRLQVVLGARRDE